MEVPPNQNHQILAQRWNCGGLPSFCIRLGLTCVLLSNFIYVGTWLPRLDNTEGLEGILLLVAIVVGKYLDNRRHAKEEQTKKRPIEEILSIGGFLATCALGFIFFPRTATFYANPWGMPWLPLNLFSSTAWLFFGMLAFAEWGFLSQFLPRERVTPTEDGFFWAMAGGVSLVGSNYWILPVFVGVSLVTLGICMMLLRKPDEIVKTHPRPEDSPHVKSPAQTGRRKSNWWGFIRFMTGTCGAFWVGFVALACVSVDHLNVLFSFCFIFTGTWYLLIHYFWPHVQTKIRGVLPKIILAGLFLGVAGFLAFQIKQSLLVGEQDLWLEILFANVLGFFLSFIMVNFDLMREMQQTAPVLSVEKRRALFVWVSLFLAAGGYLGSRTIDPSNFTTLLPILIVGFCVVLFLAIVLFAAAHQTKRGEELAKK